MEKSHSELFLLHFALCHSSAFCHKVLHCEFFTKIPFMPLEITLFQSLLKTHDCRWGQDKKHLRKESFSSCFVTTRAIKLYQSLCQPPCSVTFWIPHQGTLNFSTCTVQLPLTCSIHCPEFPKRYNASASSVLFLISAWLRVAENWSSVEGACQRIKAVSHLPQKNKQLI